MLQRDAVYKGETSCSGVKSEKYEGLYENFNGFKEMFWLVVDVMVGG